MLRGERAPTERRQSPVQLRPDVLQLFCFSHLRIRSSTLWAPPRTGASRSWLAWAVRLLPSTRAVTYSRGTCGERRA